MSIGGPGPNPPDTKARLSCLPRQTQESQASAPPVTRLSLGPATQGILISSSLILQRTCDNNMQHNKICKILPLAETVMLPRNPMLRMKIALPPTPLDDPHLQQLGWAGQSRGCRMLPMQAVSSPRPCRTVQGTPPRTATCHPWGLN